MDDEEDLGIVAAVEQGIRTRISTGLAISLSASLEIAPRAMPRRWPGLPASGAARHAPRLILGAAVARSRSAAMVGRSSASSAELTLAHWY
jgi:hypothetical protein